MFNLMIFMFCFFLGIAAMFFYLSRKLDNMARALIDEHAQSRVLLRAMESRLDSLAAPAEKPARARREEGPATDPLLHLSFDEPAEPEKSLGRETLDLYLPDPEGEK